MPGSMRRSPSWCRKRSRPLTSGSPKPKRSFKNTRADPFAILELMGRAWHESMSRSLFDFVEDLEGVLASSVPPDLVAGY